MDDLLIHAVGQARISGLKDILRDIASRTKSYGCILWQAAKPFALDPPKGHLFVLADWFPQQIYCANHDLALATSKAGLALRTGEQQNVVSVTRELAQPDPFLIKFNLESFCISPIEFSDGEIGTLNLFRTKDQKPYNARDLKKARELAKLVPMLYGIISDSVSFKLLSGIDQIAERFDKPIPASSDPIEHAKDAMRAICTNISGAFNCVETSVFLEDRLKAPKHYKLAGTTWPRKFERTTYVLAEQQGITGWSLNHPDQPVRIFDLESFKDDPDYPGMKWADSLSTRNADVIRDILGIPEEEPLPPSSMMTAPIIRSGSVIGLIRCSIARGPIYFSDAEHTILKMVASRLGSIWGGLLDRREMEEETTALETLVRSIGALNGRIYYEAQKEKTEKDTILEDTLAVGGSVVPGATINDVCLLTEDQKSLKFAALQGDAWSEGSMADVQRRKTHVFPLDADGIHSAGRHVIASGEVYVIPDVSKDPYYATIFPQVKKMIVAPLILGMAGRQAEMFGVIDFRSTTEREFPRHARSIAGLLGTQLALYLKLSAVIRELRRMRDIQIQVNADMDHQFKSPIVIAYARVQEALKAIPDETPESKTPLIQLIQEKLLIVRGSCARAMHVGQNSRLFAQLARNEPLTVKKATVTKNELLSMLINAGTDAAMLHDQQRQDQPRPSKKLWGVKTERGKSSPRYKVDTDTFKLVGSVQIDKSLFEQVVTQVLDNAFKYSFPHTTVEVTGGYINRGAELRISVINQGIPIGEDEVRHCTERGWQSENARDLGEGGGSGIGLWIANAIMEAMGGSLKIIPTTRDRRTEIQMIVPV